MTEDLKYKIGDKVLIEAVIEDIRYELAYPYILNATDGTPLTPVNENFFNKPCVRPLTKPKVTQELMNWYENSGKELNLDLFDLFTDFEKGHYIPSTVYRWLADGKTIKENQERQYALATLFLHGPEAVEVVKEPLYVVAIPDHSRDEFVQLWRNKKGKLMINREFIILVSDAHKLTESEIKAYDERLWVFAQPVEEVYQ